MCESHSVDKLFAQLFEKLLALSTGCGQIPNAQLVGSPKQMGACNFFLYVKML